MHSIFRIALFSLLILPTTVLAGEDHLIFQDNFEEKLKDGWSWVRDKPDARRIRDGGLEIRKFPGGIKSARNLLVRPASEAVRKGTPIRVEVTVEHQRKKQYEQAGLVWYIDDEHYVKFVMEQVDGNPKIVLGGTAGGGGIKPLDSDKAHLRLQITDNKIIGFYRLPDHKEWNRVAEANRPEGERPKLSLQCYHGPKDTKRWARFTRFRVNRLPDNEE